MELAEVKVRTALDYGYGRFPMYVLYASQVEQYKNYSKQKNLPLRLYFVDEERGGIFFQNLDKLEQDFHFEGKTFPFNKQMADGIFRCYSVEQFELRPAGTKLVSVKAELSGNTMVPNLTRMNFYRDGAGNIYARIFQRRESWTPPAC